MAEERIRCGTVLMNNASGAIVNISRAFISTIITAHIHGWWWQRSRMQIMIIDEASDKNYIKNW